MSDDMKLPDDLAALFDAEREIMPAEPALKARVLRGLEQTLGDLGGGEGGASGSERASGEASGTGVGSSGGGLEFSGAAMGGGAVTSGVSLAQIAGISALTFLAGAGTGVVLDRSVRAPEIVEVPVEVPVERIVEVPVPTPMVPDASVVVLPRAQSALPKASRSPDPGASALQQEQRLIDTSRAQIDKAPERALATLARYRRQFPNGLLAEEAAVIEVLALQNAGREAQAQRAAKAFLQAHPKSMFRRRVEEAVQ